MQLDRLEKKKAPKPQLYHRSSHTGRHALLNTAPTGPGQHLPRGSCPRTTAPPGSGTAGFQWTSQGRGRVARIQRHPEHPRSHAGSVPASTARRSSWASGCLSPHPLPATSFPLPWPQGRAPVPSPSAAGVTPHPRIGWGQEESTERTVHWAPRLFRSSRKGKGGSPWGPPIGVWAKAELPGPQPLLVV